MNRENAGTRRVFWMACILTLAAGLLVQCSAQTGPEEEPPIPEPASTPTMTQTDELLPAPTEAATLRPPKDVSEEEMTDLPPVPTPFRGADQLVELARQDLARRLGVDAADIELESAEAVVWPDGSLGCPRPGMVYTQVLQDGYRILLRVGKEIYAYHGGGSRGPFLCEGANDAPLPPPGLGDD